MAALRGLLHIPRTAVREIKLSNPTSSSASSSSIPSPAISRTDSASCLSGSTCDFARRYRSPSKSSISASSFSIDARSNESPSTSSSGCGQRRYSTTTTSQHQQLHRPRGSFDTHYFASHLNDGRREFLRSTLAVHDLLHSSARSVSTQPPEKPKSFMEGVFSNMKDEFK